MSTQPDLLIRASDTLVRSFSSTSSSLNSTASSGSHATLNTVREADRWTLRSTSTTSAIPGLGMISGKAIHSLGKFEIRAIRRIWIVYRQLAITLLFPHDANSTWKGLGAMYDDLIDFTRVTIYGAELSSWAIRKLEQQVAHAPTTLLQRALARTPASLRLTTLYMLCSYTWPPTHWCPASRQSAWDLLAEPLAHKLQHHYASPTQICNQEQIEILLMLAVRWPCNEQSPGLWVSRLADCQYFHYEASRPRFDLTASVIYRTELYARAHHLGYEAGDVGAQAAPLFRRLLDTYDAICSYFAMDPRSRLDAYSSLASSVKGLGRSLFQKGRYKKAFIHCEQAVEIHRILASADSEYFQEELAETLHNLSRCFYKLTKHEQAVSTGIEGVQLFQKLLMAQTQSPRLNSRFAQAILDVARELCCVGRPSEAVTVCRRATHLYRQCSRLKPQEFNGRLAWSLYTLSICLLRSHCAEEALSANQEAAELFEAEIEIDESDVSETCMANLAMALEHLCACLYHLGRGEEAITIIRKALRLRRRLAQSWVAKPRLRLANALNDLSRCLLRIGRQDEAIAANNEAVHLCVGLKPRTQQSDLRFAWAVGTRSLYWCLVSQWHEALPRLKTATKLFHQLTTYDADAIECLERLLTDFNQCLPLHSWDWDSKAIAVREELTSLRSHANSLTPPKLTEETNASLAQLARDLESELPPSSDIDAEQPTSVG